MEVLISELKEGVNGVKQWSRHQNYRQLTTTSTGLIRWQIGIRRPFEFNGSRWVEYKEPLSSSTRTWTSTFGARWSESYDGNNNIKPREYTLGRLYQGRYGHHNTIDDIYYDPIYWGAQRSLIGFDAKDIQRRLAGTSIEKVELYLKNEHFWYAKGGKASIVSHNFTTKPSKFNYVESVTETSFRKGQGKWISLPLYIGHELRNGTITGLGLYKNSNDLNYYGYFTGANLNHEPVLRVTYRRNIYETTSGEAFLTNKRTDVEPEYFNHMVKTGDTLWSIAKFNNVTVAQLQEWNNLTSSLIRPNDTIKIYREYSNVSAPAAVPRYTSVIAGEGLVQVTERLMRQGLLSQDFFEARMMLMSLNGFTTSAPLLHPGDQIMYSRGSG